jgi:ribulose-phosphate 3-epimerase
MTFKIAPSILTADFRHLGKALQAAERGGADWIHLDVMDGHFVPNLTIGPLVATSLRPATRLPFDVHLMISEPDRFIPAFCEAGADSITVHVEATDHLHRTVQLIRRAGKSAGVALNPATPVEAVREILPFVDLVLVMSVNPGFGGQQFIKGSFRKLERMRQLLAAEGFPEVLVQVDGGVTLDNVAAIVSAGADVVVAGAAVYDREHTPEENLRLLREAVTRGSVSDDEVE